MLLASYSPTGDVRWARRIGGVGEDLAGHVALTLGGEITLIGSFEKNLDLGGAHVESHGGSDIFLAGYTAEAGQVRWTRRFGTGCHADRGRDVALDRQGNITTTGWFMCSPDFGGIKAASAGQRDVFVVSYTPKLALRWMQSFGDTSEDYGRGVAMDPNGNTFVVGEINGTADFGCGSATSHGGKDIFVVSYDPKGACRWFHTFGGPYQDYGSSIAVVPNDGVVVTGNFARTMDPGGGPLTASGNSSDIFVVRYGHDGAYRWSKVLGGGGSERGKRVKVNRAGNIVLLGTFDHTFKGDGYTLPSAGGWDILALSLAPDGTNRWTRQLGGPGDDDAGDVAFDANGAVYMTGSSTTPDGNKAIFLLRLE